MPESIFEAARARRQQLIAELTACACEYPLYKSRNMSGHASTCPADALWRRVHLDGNERKESR